MAIRKILVPLSGRYAPDDPESLEKPALETGFTLGRRLNAHVEVFCIEAQPSETIGHIAPWLPTYGIEELIDMVAKESDRRRERAKQMFEDVANRFAAPRLVTADPNVGFSTNLLEEVGEVHGSLAIRGRLADLIVTASPSMPEGGDIPAMLEIALRETGRPLLVSPFVAQKTFGKKIAIAWNGTAEAACAVSLAMELLEAAEEVIVVTVMEGGAFEPSADSLAAYLRWHNINARVVAADCGGSPAGQVLLDRIAEENADMLVMGAYTRDRLQRIIFGGVTREVLTSAPIPVFMVD